MLSRTAGGLVSRAAIIEDSTFSDSIRLFVSISSPLGAERAGKTGVGKSPAVIPSWKDVEPDSPYIQRIFAKNWARPIRQYLFFGHKEGGGSLSGKTTTILLPWSMLDPRAQADALKVTGLNTKTMSAFCAAGNAPALSGGPWPPPEDHKNKTYVRSRGYLQVEHASIRPAQRFLPRCRWCWRLPERPEKKQLKSIRFNPGRKRAPSRPAVTMSASARLGSAHPDHLDAGGQGRTDYGCQIYPEAAGNDRQPIYAKTALDDRFWGFYRNCRKSEKSAPSG